MNKQQAYIAKWPDESYTVIVAESERDLFWSLDEYDNPYDAEIRVLPYGSVVDFNVQIHDGQYTCQGGARLSDDLLVWVEKFDILFDPMFKFNYKEMR